MQTSNIVIIWYIRDIRSAFFVTGDSWLWLEYCLILPECDFPALYPHVIPGSVVNIVLYCRREEVLPETFASLIPPALPAPPIYEVMDDYGSPVEPPLASFVHDIFSPLRRHGCRRRPSLSSSLRRCGCRRRSVPVRSGASQFAFWAPPAGGYVTWS